MFTRSKAKQHGQGAGDISPQHIVGSPSYSTGYDLYKSISLPDITEVLNHVNDNIRPTRVQATTSDNRTTQLKDQTLTNTEDAFCTQFPIHQQPIAAINNNATQAHYQQVDVNTNSASISNPMLHPLYQQTAMYQNPSQTHSYMPYPQQNNFQPGYQMPSVPIHYSSTIPIPQHNLTSTREQIFTGPQQFVNANTHNQMSVNDQHCSTSHQTTHATHRYMVPEKYKGDTSLEYYLSNLMRYLIGTVGQIRKEHNSYVSVFPKKMTKHLNVYQNVTNMIIIL